MQTGTPAPTPREASSFSQIPGAQWRSSSQFQPSPATPHSGGNSAVDVQQQQHTQQWQTAAGRPQNPSEHITSPRSALTESAPDYGYMMHAGPSQQVRSNSHPQLQQYGVAQAPPQQQQHPSQYGQMSHDQQMMMMQQERNQRQQSQPPIHPQQQMRGTAAPEQPIFYAPYSRQQ